VSLNLCLVASALGQDIGKPKADNFESRFPELALTVGVQAMTDYNYRGITESAHRPSIYGSFDAQLGWFYVSTEAYSVKLPTSPRAEVIVGAGIRPKLGAFDFDIVLYDFLYPGEIATPGFPASTDYWELNGKMSHKLTPAVTLGTELAYSASYSNSGAWATYLAGKFKIDLPSTLLPKDVSWTLSGDLARQWFGSVSPSMGGFALPSYTYWHLGLAFNYSVFGFDLSYYDTNLSKENCYVVAGDPRATSGGRINLISNPQGLRSGWCGAAFIATLSVELKDPEAK
jgi:uncharacterized protein (TIGR02001 family)